MQFCSRHPEPPRNVSVATRAANHGRSVLVDVIIDVVVVVVGDV